MGFVVDVPLQLAVSGVSSSPLSALVSSHMRAFHFMCCHVPPCVESDDSTYRSIAIRADFAVASAAAVPQHGRDALRAVYFSNSGPMWLLFACMVRMGGYLLPLYSESVQDRTEALAGHFVGAPCI
eukprot:SAG25_NODE_131_length_14413_cov_29.573984_3_plen_126_part_00